MSRTRGDPEGDVGEATSPALDRVTEELTAERAIVVARLVGVVFALYMVATYDAEPYPPGIEAAAYGLIGALALSTLPVLVSLRRVATWRAARALSLSTLVLDALVLVAFVWLYAFDDGSVHFLLLFVLPAEAALKLRLGGAIAAWAACIAGYLGREVWAGQQFGHAVNLPSIAFRMGILLLVSLVMGVFAQRMFRHARDLREALARLEAEERWRTALIDMLAHDLRSPIGTASSALELLQRTGGSLDREQTEQLIRGAARQNQQALSLTDDLLELARARQGHLELRREPVDLRAALERAVAQLDETDEWVSIEVAGTGPSRLDPARLHQILVNLLSNARKHGCPPVGIRAQVDEDQTLIRVTDHGRGISASDQMTLFEPLRRGPRTDSVGLGLWIVRTLTEAHSGEASYTTTDGLPTFVIRLPHDVRIPQEA